MMAFVIVMGLLSAAGLLLVACHGLVSLFAWVAVRHQRGMDRLALYDARRARRALGKGTAVLDVADVAWPVATFDRPLAVWVDGVGWLESDARSPHGARIEWGPDGRFEL